MSEYDFIELNEDGYRFNLTPKHRNLTKARTGKSLNDSTYNTRYYHQFEDGSRAMVRCPIKTMFDHMHNRSRYGKSIVCDEWSSFMNFRSWVLMQPNWSEYELDKDLIGKGCKIYSPEYAKMIPSRLNKQLGDLSKMLDKTDEDGTPIENLYCIGKLKPSIKKNYVLRYTFQKNRHVETFYTYELARLKLKQLYNAKIDKLSEMYPFYRDELLANKFIIFTNRSIVLQS